MNVRAERRAGGARAAMPVRAVLVEAVAGREVEAAAEPPDRGLAVPLRDEEAQVRVGGRRERIARVHDQRERDRLEAPASELGSVRGRGGRKRGPARVREVHRGALEHRAIREHARTRRAAVPTMRAPEGAVPSWARAPADAILESGGMLEPSVSSPTRGPRLSYPDDEARCERQHCTTPCSHRIQDHDPAVVFEIGETLVTGRASGGMGRLAGRLGARVLRRARPRLSAVDTGRCSRTCALGST